MLSLWTGAGQWGRNPLFQESQLYLLYSSFSRSLNFSVSSVFFQEFHENREIHEFHVLRSLLRDWLHNWSLGSEKKIVPCIVCFAYSLAVVVLCSLVVLNCLYLSPWVSPFVLSPPHPTAGEGEGWASGCLGLVACCQVKPRHPGICDARGFQALAKLAMPTQNERKKIINSPLTHIRLKPHMQPSPLSAAINNFIISKLRFLPSSDVYIACTARELICYILKIQIQEWNKGKSWRSTEKNTTATGVEGC